MTKAIRVPNPSLAHVQALCEVNQPYVTGQMYDDLFMQAMTESIVWHRTHCEPYNHLLTLRNFAVQSLQTLSDCAQLPFIHANFFKTHELLSIDHSDVSAHMTSSGTTGQKSQMFFDSWTLQAGQRMVDFLFEHNGWNTPDEPANYLMYTYEPEGESHLGTAYTDHYLWKFAEPSQVFYGLRRTGAGNHEFDVFGCIQALERFAESGLPIRILGFPSFLHFTLERMRQLGVKPLQFSPKSLIMLGGGWKGYADKQIPKRELYARVTEQLGIPDERCRDGFGSVEHSIPYFECANHNFHVPVWSRVFIRDVRTLAPLGLNQAGFLHFVSPYITSVPAISVLMGDLAMLHPGEHCGCGITTPYFEMLGRAGTSKNKSCAIAAAELLRRASS